MTTELMISVAPLAGDRVREFEGTRPFIATGSLDDLGHMSGEMVTFDSRPSRADITVQDGDVCFARMLGTKKVFRFRGVHQDLILSTGFAVLRPDPQKLDPDYLYHFLKTDNFQKEKNARCSGATQKAITNGAIATLKIPVPPTIDDQRRIAVVLDKADALLRRRQDTIQLTEKLLQSVFIDMFGDPETNPMGFSECTIGDLLVSASYGTSAKASAAGTWPVLRMGNITYEGGWDFSSLKYMELDSKEERKYLVRNGEILFNRTNSKDLVGKTAVYREAKPMAFAGYLIRCTVNDEADPEYVAAYLNSTHGKKILQSMCKSIVGMANINAKELKAITILKPPVDLQKKFGEAVRSILRLRATLTEASQSDGSLFSSIQQRAFRGELDLSRLNLDVVKESPMVTRLEPIEVQSRYNRPGSFIAPPEVETQMIALEDQLDFGKGDSIPWDENYFKFRTISQVLRPPFSLREIWEAIEYDIEGANYETVKEKVFDYVAAGILEQQFDEERKEIVFHPRP